jgi:hypothetical protein
MRDMIESRRSNAGCESQRGLGVEARTANETEIAACVRLPAKFSDDIFLAYFG